MHSGANPRRKWDFIFACGTGGLEKPCVASHGSPFQKSTEILTQGKQEESVHF